MDTQHDNRNAFVDIRESTRSRITGILVKVAAAAFGLLTLLMVYGIVMVRRDASMVSETVLVAGFTIIAVIYTWRTPPMFAAATKDMEKASRVDILKVGGNDAGSEIPLGRGTMDDAYLVRHVSYMKNGTEREGVIISKNHRAALYTGTEAAHPVLPEQGMDPDMMDYSMLREARNRSKAS